MRTTHTPNVNPINEQTTTLMRVALKQAKKQTRECAQVRLQADE